MAREKTTARSGTEDLTHTTPGVCDDLAKQVRAPLCPRVPAWGTKGCPHHSRCLLPQKAGLCTQVPPPRRIAHGYQPCLGSDLTHSQPAHPGSGPCPGKHGGVQGHLPDLGPRTWSLSPPFNLSGLPEMLTLSHHPVLQDQKDPEQCRIPIWSLPFVPHFPPLLCLECRGEG